MNRDPPDNVFAESEAAECQQGRIRRQWAPGDRRVKGPLTWAQHNWDLHPAGGPQPDPGVLLPVTTDPQQPGFKPKPTQIPSQVFNPNAAQSSEETPVREVERVNQPAALKPPLPVKETSVSRFVSLKCFMVLQR